MNAAAPGTLRVPSAALLGLALSALVAGIAATNVALEARAVRLHEPGRLGPLPDGRALRVLSLGFERLVADLYWLRTVYYIGDEEVDAAGFPEVERLAELVTDIDPYFRSAYVVLTSVLTVLKPPSEYALQFLDKGIRHNPRHWKLRFLKGFTLFYDFQRYNEAAQEIEAAARLGGPAYLPLLATRLYARGGSPETAIAFVHARLRETEDPKVRKRLERRLPALYVARDLAALDAAIATYRTQRRREPRNVRALVAAGLLSREPLDPDGKPYRIERGRAHASGRYDALELHGVEGGS